MGRSAAMRAVLIAVAVALVVAMLGAADAAPIDVEAVRDVMESTQGDLGESVAVNESEDDSEEVGDMGSYAATKKKLEGKIKKIQAALKKKKAKAKKQFQSEMKKSSATFAKLTGPKVKKGPKAILDSPLGMHGQSGVSDFVQWGYASRVHAWSTVAHKQIAKLEAELEENRWRHFSTAVCKEVLASKVNAIGDLAFKHKKRKIDRHLKREKSAMRRKIAEDHADMMQKLNSYSLWATDSTMKLDGGITGPDPTKTHMLSPGETMKMSASRVGELKQAAHWAFARAKANSINVWERNRKKLLKQMKKITKQHDLTLCRTGRKPENPQLKYELKQAKKGLKKQLAKMPKAKDKKAKKKVAKAKKAEKKAKKKGEEDEQDEDIDLGESESINDPAPETDLDVDEAAVEFHKLVQASGGAETLAGRVQMYKDLQESEELEQHNIVTRNAELAAGASE